MNKIGPIYIYIFFFANRGFSSETIEHAFVFFFFLLDTFLFFHFKDEKKMVWVKVFNGARPSCG